MNALAYVRADATKMAQARDYVDRVSHRIVLIDGDRLARLMIAHGVGVRTRRTYAVQGVDEDYFSET